MAKSDADKKAKAKVTPVGVHVAQAKAKTTQASAHIAPECQAMVTRLVSAARTSQIASDMFDEAVGKLFGTNRTDGRCVDLIQRYGRMTAGQLSEQSGLTTGAVTTALDRMEQAGYVRRVRDEEDRRRVFVELTDFARNLCNVLFRPISGIYSQAMSGISLEDMRVISEYLEFTDRVNRRHTKILQRHTPEGETDNEDRLRHAQRFARESKSAAPELIDSWREEPDASPVSGSIRAERQRQTKGHGVVKKSSS